MLLLASSAFASAHFFLAEVACANACPENRDKLLQLPIFFSPIGVSAHASANLRLRHTISSYPPTYMMIVS